MASQGRHGRSGLRRSRACAAAVASLLLAASACADAQAARDDRGRGISPTDPQPAAEPRSSPRAAENGDIVVTAARTNAGQISDTGGAGLLGNRSIFDTPFSSTAYTDKLITDQQARSLADILDNNPSVRTEGNTFTDGEDQNIRGFDVGSQSLYINGLNGLIGMRRTPLEAVERVDVFLGPNALLNPDAPVGGSISLTTKRAGDAPRTTLTGRYVADSDFGGQADIGRRFGADGMFGARGNIAYDHGATPIDKQKDTYFIGSAGLDARIGGLTLSGDVIREHWRLLGLVRPFSLADGARLPAAPDLSTNVSDKSSTFAEGTLIGLVHAGYAFSDATSLSLSYGHSDYRADYRNASGGQILNAAGDIQTGAGSYVVVYHSNSAQARFRTSFATGPVHHEINLSADATWGHYGSVYVPDGGPILTNLYRPVPLAPLVHNVPGGMPDLSESHDKNFAAADTATLFDGRVSLTAGVRRQIAQDANKWTPAVALLVKPVARLSLYANYIQALEAGPVADFPALNAGQIFPPAVTDQKEIGAKYEAGKAGFTLAVFEINRPDYYTNVRTNIFGQFGDTRNRGIEANAFGEIVPMVRLLGGASYYDTVQRHTPDTNNDGRGDTDGRQVVGSQHVRVNLGAEWDVRWVPGLTLTARGIHTSRTFLDPDNGRALPAWTRLDLGGRYTVPMDGKPLTIRLQVTNATATRYWQTTSQYFYPGVPRTVRLSLSKDL